MNLIFEKDEQRNKLIKGYQENWDLTRNNGSYNSGKDFISVHWELHYDSPSVVRLDVESPTKSIDYELNFLKQRIIIGILSKTFDIKNSIKLGDFEVASRLFTTDSTKSTEVFHIKMFDNYVRPSYKDNVLQVHAQVGEIIDKVVSKFASEFNSLGLK